MRVDMRAPRQCAVQKRGGMSLKRLKRYITIGNKNIIPTEHIMASVQSTKSRTVKNAVTPSDALNEYNTSNNRGKRYAYAKKAPHIKRNIAGIKMRRSAFLSSA
jgi:hypothetical protein